MSARTPQEEFDAKISPCCAKEAEINKRRSETEAVLKFHDLVADLERRHKITFLPNLELCRCCHTMEDEYVHDYPALQEYRRDQMMIESGSEDDEQSNPDDATGCAVGGLSVFGDDDDDNYSDDDDDEFDYLLDANTMNISAVEENRIMELKVRAMQLKSAHGHGYGVHRQIHYSKVFTVGAGIDSPLPPEAAVIHLYDPYSVACAKLDVILEGPKFAHLYKGTKFLRADGKMAVRLSQIVSEEHIPCLIAVREGNLVSYCANLTGIVDRGENVDEWALEEWLDNANVLIRDMPSIDTMCRIRPEEEALLASMMKSSKPDDYCRSDDYYDCGVENCEKTFPHKHIGIPTDEQDGLVISESDLKSF